MNTSLILRLAPAAVMIIFGIAQLIQPEAWLQYIPDWLPFNHMLIMRGHAIFNIILGVLLASGWQAKYVVPVVIAWWLSIVPFAFAQDWTIGVRDLAIITELIVLAML